MAEWNRVSDKARRSGLLSIRISELERKELDRICKDANITISQLLREAIVLKRNVMKMVDETEKNKELMKNYHSKTHEWKNIGDRTVLKAKR